MSYRVHPGFALALGTMLSAGVCAQEQSFSISGFGTLGAVYHTSDAAEFRRDISYPEGVRAHRLAFDQDSMLGIQATLRPHDSFEATLQLLSRRSIDTDYQPQVTWAFAKWKPRGDLTFRLGRIGIDLYLQGDSAEVGYANLPIRQPLIIYPRLADGMDAEWTSALGGGTLRLKGQWGSTTGQLISNGASPYDTQGSRGTILVAEYARSGWTGRFSTGRLVLRNGMDDASSRALYAGLAAAPRGAEILDAIVLNGRPMNYVSTALAYDVGPIQGMAAYSSIATPHVPDQKAVYTQIGYRLGQLTPYAAYTHQWTDRSLISTGIPWGLSQATDALNQGAAVAQSSMWANQSIAAIGVRYELSHNTAIKFQVDRIRYQDAWSILGTRLLNEDVASRDYRVMTVCSGALEFVF